MIKVAIANYINAFAEKNKPCQHEWLLLHTTTATSKLNTNYEWKEFTYRCSKCCSKKFIDTKKEQYELLE